MWQATEERRAPLWPFFTAVCVVGAALLWPAAGYLARYGIPLSSAAGIYFCFLLLFMYAAAPAVSGSRALLGKLLARRSKPLLLIALLTLPYLVYAIGASDLRFTALLRVLAIAATPVILYSVFPVHDEMRFVWQDILVALWLIAVVLAHLFDDVWNVPRNLDFMGRLFILALRAMCWTYIRPVPDLGYSIEEPRPALTAAATNFALFAIVAIPLGFALGFIAWNPRGSFVDFLLAYLEIFVFIAALEELFFRGFLQNLLSKSLHCWWRGQLLASCIFGLFHILHQPVPNWRYVLLASIAGWFYGSAYRSAGTLLSSVLLHSAVDAVWRTFFTKT